MDGLSGSQQGQPDRRIPGACCSNCDKSCADDIVVVAFICRSTDCWRLQSFVVVVCGGLVGTVAAVVVVVVVGVVVTTEVSSFVNKMSSSSIA